MRNPSLKQPMLKDTWLPYAYAGQRTLRIADGPDEAHLMTLAKMIIKESSKL